LVDQNIRDLIIQNGRVVNPVNQTDTRSVYVLIGGQEVISKGVLEYVFLGKHLSLQECDSVKNAW